MFFYTIGFVTVSFMMKIVWFQEIVLELLFFRTDDRQSSRCTRPPLTSVEEAEVLQVAENCGGFAAQKVEASRDVLLHCEAA